MCRVIQQCPICKTSVEPSPRYPNYLCNRCSRVVTDRGGRNVQFFNTGIFGGIEGQYSDDGTLYESQECFIGGSACMADEARFGGIVIEVLR